MQVQPIGVTSYVGLLISGCEQGVILSTWHIIRQSIGSLKVQAQVITKLFF